MKISLIYRELICFRIWRQANIRNMYVKHLVILFSNAFDVKKYFLSILHKSIKLKTKQLK